MRTLIWFLLLLPIAGYSQNADWKELQGMIDAAVKTNGTVRINRNYKIDKPLIVANWNGREYSPVSVNIIGDATMWDVNARSVIRASFNSAPLLSVQRGKKIRIRGINFQGIYAFPNISTEEFYSKDVEVKFDPEARDSRFSPYSAVAIDPFSSSIPPDGGYPDLKAWYRGPRTENATNDLIINDCTFSGFTVGFVLSPSDELKKIDGVRLENIRLSNSKIGFAGTQETDMNIKVINVGAWGKTHTLFGFNLYGSKGSGNWEVSALNIAGDVVQMINRRSTSASMQIKDVFAESLGKIGTWNSKKSDTLSLASINFRYVDQTLQYPEFVLNGENIVLTNSTIRYYGQKSPMVFMGNNKLETIHFDTSIPIILNEYLKRKTTPLLSLKSTPKKGLVSINGKAKKGDPVLFFDEQNKYIGCGTVEQADTNSYQVGNFSKKIKAGKAYRMEVIN